jgi:hypothetical protein
MRNEMDWMAFVANASFAIKGGMENEIEWMVEYEKREY